MNLIFSSVLFSSTPPKLISIVLQSQRIDPKNWIRRILKQIHSTHQPTRILTNESSNLRIVIAETVVVQATFFVVILSLEAERDVGFEAV